MSAFLKRSSGLLVALLALPLYAQEADIVSPPEELLNTDSAIAEEEWVEETSSSAIEIAEFAAPKAGGVGAYSAGEANLPYDLWKSVSEEEALTLLSSFPQKVDNRAIRQLFYRLVAMEMANSDYTQAMLQARVMYFTEAGQWVLASKLMEALPQSMLSAELEKQRFLLEVLTQKSHQSSCKTAHDKQVSSPEAFWQRFQILCLVKQKEAAKAQLGLELLREQNNISALFDVLFQYASHASEVRQKPDLSNNEQLAWAVLAGYLDALKDSDSIRLKALYQLHFAKKQEQDKALNLASLTTPHDDVPSIPVSLLRLNKEKANAREALLAFALRKSWEQSVPLELQNELRDVQAESNVIELPLIWREQVLKLQESEQRLPALAALISPFTKPLHRYAIADLLFLVEELKVLGLPADAAAVTEEALAGGK